MNPIEWRVTTQIIAAGSLVGALVAIVTGLPALADTIPFATRAYVIEQNKTILAQLQQQTLANSVYQIQTLDFQITSLLTQKFALEDTIHATPSVDKQVQLDRLVKQINDMQRQRDLLDCQVKFAVTGVTCVQSP